MLEPATIREREVIEKLSAEHGEPQWLLEQRLHSWRLYEDMALPTGREEEWRRTDVSFLSLYREVSTPSKAVGDECVEQGGSIAFHPERFPSDLPADLKQQGVVFTDLHAAAREHSDLLQPHFMTEAVQPITWKFTALHAALWRGGSFLYVPAGVEVALPLRVSLRPDIDGCAIFPHTLIVAEPDSKVMLFEEHGSSATGRSSLSHAVVEILAREGSHVRYIGLQNWGPQVNSFLTLRALLAKDATLELGIVGLGARVARSTLSAVLTAPGARAEMTGLSFGSGRQHFDFETVQDHLAPDTTSSLLMKTAVTDTADMAWRGRTHIHKGAGMSDATQESRSLILSEQAKVTPEPILEIEAHDVERCSHGATVSSVDEDELYYMMSRGLPREEASRAIVEGFFQQGLSRMLKGDQKLADGIGRLLTKKLLAKVS